jgi:antitoxin MazE
MEIPIIPIGNSKGIRLSKTILEKYNISDRVDLVMEEDRLVILPVLGVRQGWEERFRAMHEQGGDDLLIDDVFKDETFEEWK